MAVIMYGLSDPVELQVGSTKVYLIASFSRIENDNLECLASVTPYAVSTPDQECDDVREIF